MCHSYIIAILVSCNNFEYFSNMLILVNSVDLWHVNVKIIVLDNV
jgi:hypothetical protein